MKANLILAILPGLLGVPLLAQPQIGGGTCNSSTLSGAYSMTLTGRDLSSTASFSNASQSVGSVSFDGLSKVAFTLTENTNKFFGTAQTLSGTYSLQSNCVGVITITSGDTATFSLNSYNQGNDYLITGQDGTYAFAGSGSSLPANCPTALTAGNYPFNGSGFGLASTAIAAVFNVLGMIQISGTNGIAMTGQVSSSLGPLTVSATGTYTLAANCSATASLVDGSGNAYKMVFEYTNASGNNFIFASSSPLSIFTGSGRVL